MGHLVPTEMSRKITKIFTSLCSFHNQAFTKTWFCAFKHCIGALEDNVKMGIQFKCRYSGCVKKLSNASCDSEPESIP